MGLVWAFDAVLPVLPTGREQRRDLVYAGAAGTPKRTGRVADGLADLELVIAHTILLLHTIVLRRRDIGSTAQDFSTQHRSLQLLCLSELTGRSRKRAEQFMRGAPERLDLSAKLYSGCKDRRGLASIGASLHHDNPAPLDLVDADPHRRSAMRTANCRFTGNGNAQIRLVSRI
jgi:hypothetical protein